jgi:FlaA1/EpsC-like NDP-sugar epimerase
MKNMFSGKSILITGATGTLGSHLIERLLSQESDIKKIIIFSRGEHKQHLLRLRFPKSDYPNIEFKIGDIRDSERLTDCSKGVDVIIHAAAMKHIPICEENPGECVKTNVDGTKNVIKAVHDNNNKKMLLFSTDKAVDPISVYGNSKQIAEKLVLNASSESSKFSIVRFGNILGSRGSVVPFWQEQKKFGVLSITHPEMTRFGGTILEGVDLIIYALNKMSGGEVFVKKLPSFSILDLAEAICPKCRKEVTGLRGHEKTHEHFLTDIEKSRAVENEAYVIVTKNVLTNDEGLDKYDALAIKEFNTLNSFLTSKKLSVSELKNIVVQTGQDSIVIKSSIA